MEDDEDNNNENVSSSSLLTKERDSSSTALNPIGIQLPVLKYGYRTKPMGWDELVHIITIENDIAKLSRSVEQQLEYEIYKRNLLQEWRSVTDYVLFTKFSTLFVKRCDTISNRTYSYPSPSDIKVVTTTLVKNDFPYCMDETNIEHWILWKLCEPCSDNDIEIAQQQLQRDYNLIEFLHWKNPPHLQSLPDIDHVHILGRKKKNAVEIII